MPYIVFKKDSEIDRKKLIYRKFRNLWDIRYKENDDEKPRSIYIQTPPLKLSILEEDHKNYYLIFKMGQSDERFWDLLASLDMSTIEEIAEDFVSWGFKEGTPISVIESHFLPTLRMSSVNYEHSLYIKVPKTDAIYMYDQDEISIGIDELEDGCRMSLLLLLDGVKYHDNYYKLKFNLEQCKVRKPQEVPEEVKNELPEELPMGECLIDNSEDDMSNYQHEDVTKYSNKPKKELYEYQEE